MTTTTTRQIAYAVPATHTDGRPLFAARDGQRLYRLTDYADNLLGVLDLATAMKVYGSDLIVLS